jgi:hypothetical protein
MVMVCTRRGLAIAVLLLALAGCTTPAPGDPPGGPLMPTDLAVNPPGREGPALIPAGSCPECEPNPIYIPQLSYGHVFETLYRVLHDYDFEIAESNRYDGRIETLPRVAPGLFELLRPGSPDLYDRLLETMQSYRHRVSIVIQPASNGGYFVEVIARKELEDLPKPVRSTIGGAIFRTENNVDRQFEVIDPTFFESTWIFKGRDVPLEQELICRIKKRL